MREARKKKTRPILTIYDIISSSQFKSHLKKSYPIVRMDKVYNEILPDYYESKVFDELNINPYNFLLPKEKREIISFFKRISYYVLRKEYKGYGKRVEEKVVELLIKKYCEDIRA